MRLKSSIDTEIKNASQPKYKILIKGIFKLFFSAPWDIRADNVSSDNRSCRQLINNHENYDAPDEYDNDIQTSPSAEGVVERIQLYSPGRLLHFVFDPVTQQSTANWIKQEYLKDIQLTGNILTDHMPHNVRRLIKSARDEHTPV